MEGGVRSAMRHQRHILVPHFRVFYLCMFCDKSQHLRRTRRLSVIESHMNVCSAYLSRCGSLDSPSGQHTIYAPSFRNIMLADTLDNRRIFRPLLGELRRYRYLYVDLLERKVLTRR